jgi:hypothetical protein
MSLRNSGPVSFSPTGVTDTLDGSNAPQGSMEALVNLIPDPTTSNLFVCRPASERLTTFPGFSSPGFISVYHVAGNLVYGMIATALVPGHDQPFCYDTNTDTFITVTGTQDATTLPLSPATSGEWTPPIMELIGVLLIVTHPGFQGVITGSYFGWFDTTNPAAPVWHAGNTAVNPLTSVPVSVAQFNGRAYYAVANSLVFSDALAATTVTLASQVLTLGDNEAVTAVANLPLSTYITGGVIQCLIAFKGVSTMYQITGDSTTGDLQVNANTVHTGTLAPNTIVPTPKGLAFVSPEGLRIISFQLAISDPIGVAGTGVTVPFIYALEPSRMCAAYNANVIRVSVQNEAALETPFQEWWFDLARNGNGVWTGPHTFPASFIHSFTHMGAGASHPSFIMAPQGIVGELWDSHITPTLTDVYVENGTQMSFEWTTSILPDTDQMSETYLTESTIKMSLPPDINAVTMTAINEDETALQAVQIAPEGTTTVWGAFTWGAALWLGTSSTYKPRRVPWTEQVTFRMIQFSLTGDSVAAFRVGTMQNRYQFTGYLQQ